MSQRINLPAVSIIIPTYNRKNELTDCLNSILRQNFKKYEIIVVDDFSTDNTMEELEKRGLLEKITYINTMARSGVSRAKNVGIGKARGKYCWFLDSDTEITKNDCLGFLYDLLENNSLIGSAGCELIERNGELLIREHSFFGNDLTYSLSEKVKMKNVDYLATCNCFVRMDLLNKVKGFNEKYFYGYEDAELGKQILDLKSKNFLDFRASVWHKRSLGTRVANYKLFFKNRIRFALWNFPIVFIFKLPLIDIKNFIAGVVKARKTETSQIRGQSISILNKTMGKFGMLLEYIYGLLFGYLWNIIFLPKTLFIDRKKLD